MALLNPTNNPAITAASQVISIIQQQFVQLARSGVTGYQLIWKNPHATPVIQQTTGGSSATFTANSGTAINSASTFDGYTMVQVVKALRTIGILA